jgi:two-component system response regulator DesR
MLASPPATDALPGVRGAKTISILLVENQRLMRCALARMLGAEPDLDVIAAVECDHDVTDTALRLRPDTVVVDIDSDPDRSLAVIEVLSRLAPDLPVVALAAPHPAVVARRLLAISPSGAIDRNIAAERLLEAIRTAARGERAIDVSLMVAALAMKPNPFTSQEMEVLRLAAEGANGPEIAAAMHLSSGTVRNYLSKIIVKTGGRGRLDAVRIARESGWL